MTFRVVGQKEESVVFVEKKGIFLSIVQREGMVVLIVESWGIRNTSAQKKEEGGMLILFSRDWHGGDLCVWCEKFGGVGRENEKGK